jgi:pyridinium-3,5-bisthiocarboxylic acid mononucleotide nickel chelatase
MARILYFDCFSGIAGDMVLGAMLDAGLPLAELKGALGSLAMSGYDVTAERVLRAGVSATKFRLIEHPAPGTQHPAPGTQHPASSTQHPAPSTHPHRHLKSIYELIDRSALSPAGRTRAKELFQRLGEAEAAIHQTSLEKVHLHEVGGLDSIIDIVGAVYALDSLSVDRVVVSPINVGRGMVQSAHGVFPVPAPATVRLLADAPVFSRGPEAELLTPTGALLLTAYANAFGPLPAMRVAATGYGAGEHEFADTPNVLRVLVGEAVGGHAHGDGVLVVESEIDDMNPQLFGSVMDQLYAAGALEVFFVAVQMKKSRPGTLVSVLVAPSAKDAIVDVLFRETTTIGVRFAEWQRECLAREIVPVATPYGDVRIKVARRHGAVMNGQPEFDDCAARAKEHGVATKDVHAAAMKAWLEHRP